MIKIVKFNNEEYRIENAFHALALDEYREPFTPTLWYKTPETQGSTPFLKMFLS